MKIKPKRYIVWSTDEIDLSHPFVRKWYIQQVLLHGNTEDIVELDWEEVRKLLPELTLPEEVRRLWDDYFSQPENRSSP
jgi:hypothetical protein